MLFILGKLVATFYAVAPFAAAFMLLFDPTIALYIFMFWLVSAASIIGLSLVVLALRAIWINE